MYLNRVELIGFVGSDAEANKTTSGKAVTNFSVATKTSWKDANDQWQDRTEWHRIQAWNGMADHAAKLESGAYVRVEGELRSREYTANDGTKVKTYDIVAQSIQRLHSAKESTK